MDEQHVESQPTPRVGVLRSFLVKSSSHAFFSDRMIMMVITGLVFLLPLFFIPTALYSPEFSKMVLIEIAAVVLVFAWGIMRLRDGDVSVPKSVLLAVSLLILVQFAIAALGSPTPLLSFVGTASEIGTVSSMAILMSLMFLSSLIYRDKDRVLTLYAALMFSTGVLMLYHLVRHFFGPIMSFDIFTSEATSPAGKWNDLASLIGALLVILLTTMYYFSQNKRLRVPAALIFIVSLLFLLVIDFTILWVILFVLSGVMMLFSIYEGERSYRKHLSEAGESAQRKALHKRIVGHIPVYAVILFLVAFIYGSGISTIPFGSNNRSISSTVSSILKAPPYSEVVLTPSFTFGIVKESIKQSPILGIGPNRFSSGYLEYKTSDMNRTPFWDSTFDFGVGRLPTFFTTTGGIGALLWLLFIVVLFMKFRKIYPLMAKDRVSAYLGSSLFLLVIYFWSLSFFYLPNIALFSFSFIFTGALIAFLVGEGVVKEYHTKFDGKLGNFLLTPLAIIVVIGALSGAVLLYGQAASVAAYNSARLAISNGNTDQAEMRIAEAIKYSDRDVYERFASSLALLKLQQLASQQGQDQKDVLQKADKLVTTARSSAERAVALDSTNFENFVSLGSVYDTLGSLGIQGTADAARSNYKKALELNPRSPRVLFLLARVELLSGNRAAGKEYLTRALAERPNFLEAISLLTQLEIQDKNIDGAIAAVKGGVALEPTNFLLHFALGYLYYANHDFKSATPEFEAAVIVNPVYADAKYFLGLTYAKQGRRDDALLQFQGVQELNPDNKDVAKIIKNLKDGKEPFDAGIATPAQPVNDAIDKNFESATGKTN